VADPTYSQNTGPNAPDTPDMYGAGRFAAPAYPHSLDGSSPFDDAHSPASPYTVTPEPLPARAFLTIEPVVPLVPEPSDVPPQPDLIPSPQPDPALQPSSVQPEPSTAPPLEHTPPPQPDAAPAQDAAPQPYADSEDDPPPLTTYRPYAQPGYATHIPVPPPSQGPPPAFGSVDPYAHLGGSTVPAPVPGFGSARPRTENVGKGLLLALIAVVAGCVLAAVVYHLGYVASIVALGMGAAGIFLYAKGAGAPPRKGAVGLIVLLMAGILLAWICSVGTELYFYYVNQTGTSKGAFVFAVNGALSLDLFKATLKDFLIFVGFGALGIFGVARQLLLPRKKK